MTYNRTLQGRFVSGKWTWLLLLLMSLVLSVAEILLAPAERLFSWGGDEIAIDGVILYSLSLLCYIPVAVIVGAVHLFERRSNWLPTLFIWLVSISFLLHGELLVAVSTFIMSVAVALLLYCQPGGELERPIYTVFAIVGFSAFILPEFLFLLPILLLGLFVGNIFSFKRLMAAILGVVTPLWLFYGLEYVYPEAICLFQAFDTGIDSLFLFYVAEPTLERLLLSAIELLVLLPSIALFVSSPIPSKPLLRRRMIFIIILDIYLMLLSWLSEENFVLFYAWRLPAVAISAFYLFTVKQTKAMNIYFVFINLMWLSMAVLGLWLR